MTDYVRYAHLEYQPSPPPPPAKILIRNTDGHPGLVVTESEAWELYLLLDKHFGGTNAQEQAE